MRRAPIGKLLLFDPGSEPHNPQSIRSKSDHLDSSRDRYALPLRNVPRSPSLRGVSVDRDRRSRLRAVVESYDLSPGSRQRRRCVVGAPPGTQMLDSQGSPCGIPGDNEGGKKWLQGSIDLETDPQRHLMM